MVAVESLIQAIVSGLLVGGLYAIVSVGLSLIFGVMRIVNLAHGDLMILAAYSTYWVALITGINPFIVMGIVVPGFFFLGVALQRYMIQRAIARPEFTIRNSVLITWGLSLLLMNSQTIAWTGNLRTIVLPESLGFAGVNIGGVFVSFTEILILSGAIVIVVIFHLMLHRTNLGRAIRACTQDREAAAILGVNFARIAYITFGLSILSAAVGGILYGYSSYFFPSLGIDFTIKAFAVIVLGGMGSIGGALMGGLLLGTVESLTSLYVGAQFSFAVSFFVLVATLIVKPSGLFGKEVK
jgi:branched-chain amino acid transport system permease protein